MRRMKSQPIRNQLDLTDAAQVRSVKKRLRLTEDELNEVVGRIGNSIAAISKEVAMKKARHLSPVPAPVADAAFVPAIPDPPEAATVVAEGDVV